ncbi:hypothetical protein [Methylocapsa palsarum]|uniref:Uncharacterized protein n=1 Tax=Methylocapsa palsarum TaxID=1612308 RepID=A0A1I3XYB7_9HYPH|nr:hypothetical protein [Methylocapsa palsarum]SFK24545.1 hypothetical protein SAMN05444581_104170 [Methylocapsa palsarum]
MVFDKVQGRSKASILAALAAGAFMAAAPLPAAAEEDTNMFNSMLGFVGLQFDKEQDAIDYRARAPIVVPPRLDLPPPKESARSASWPTDPDVVERRRAALSANQPAPQPTPNARVEMSPRDLSRVTGDLPKEGPPSECQAGSGTPICLYAPWKALQAAVGGGGQADVVQPGVEPSRKYLTEPPPGYRKATAATALAPDKVKEEADPSDPAAYNRSQRRKNSVDN